MRPRVDVIARAPTSATPALANQNQIADQPSRPGD
jgi:hypothetical protein